MWEPLLIIFLCIILIIFVIFCKNRRKEPFTQIEFPNVYYINLEKRKDRKKGLLKQLEKIGYPQEKIHRIDAIENKINGHEGCRLSHIIALKKFLKTNDSVALILEDDFQWDEPLEKTKKKLKKIISTQAEWDRFILSCRKSTRRLRNDTFDYKDDSLLNNSGEVVLWCLNTSGYFVNRQEAKKLVQLWELTPVTEYNQNYAAIDQTWNQLNTKRTKFLPVGHQRSNDFSDIESKKVFYDF